MLFNQSINFSKDLCTADSSIELALSLSARSRCLLLLGRVHAALDDSHDAVNAAPALPDAHSTLQEVLVAWDQSRQVAAEESAQQRKVGGEAQKFSEGQWVACMIPQVCKVVFGLVVFCEQCDGSDEAGAGAGAGAEAEAHYYYVEVALGAFVRLPNHSLAPLPHSKISGAASTARLMFNVASLCNQPGLTLYQQAGSIKIMNAIQVFQTIVRSLL